MLFRTTTTILLRQIFNSGRQIRRTMRVLPIPAFQDNYMYLVVDERSKKAAIVDPVDVKAIHDAVKAEGAVLEQAWVTHHHADHACSTAELASAGTKFGASMGALRIFGGDSGRIQAQDVQVGDGEEWRLGDHIAIRGLHTPCHTSTHICYFVTDEQTNQRAVFTGDTLFIAGCGRFFEGTAEQMHQALNVKLAGLPDDTEVYCGHEYTMQNLKFAMTIEPTNSAITNKMDWAKQQRAAGRPTVPSTIGQEKQHNVFMRVHEPGMQQHFNTPNNLLMTMSELRKAKDKFRG